MQAQSSPRILDRYVGLAILTAYMIFMIFVVTFMRPWGNEPSIATDFDSYWGGVAMASDFVSFWTGASLVREGAGSALYDLDRQAEFQRELRLGRFESPRLVNRLDPFHNPPPMALLYLPFTLLPLAWAFVVWVCVSIVTLGAAVWLPLREHPRAWALTSILLATGAVTDGLLWGQSDPIFLFFLVVGLLALGSGRSFLGGALLGVLWLKPQYALVFPVVFLVRRRWAELAGMAFTGVMLAALSVAMIGFDGVALYLETLRRAGMYYPPESSFVFPELMVNWRALLTNVFPGLPEESGVLLVTALGGFTLVGSLLAWTGAWRPGSARFALQMLVATAAAVVAAPHSHLHGVTLLSGPLALWAAASQLKECPPWLTKAVMPVGFVLTWIGWLAPSLRWLLAPYLVFSIALIVRHLRTTHSLKSDL